MRIICVDDHSIILSQILSDVKAIMPDAEVVGFSDSDDAMTLAGEKGCDVLFTEIELYGKPSGLELARSVQQLNPRVNIIFSTVCSEREYAGEVMELRPSGYLRKVATRQDVQHALQHLLYAVNG